MGNTIKANWSSYIGGDTATSAIVGYESSKNRVMRYMFETDSDGASHIYVELTNLYFRSGNIYQDICWYIGTDANSHKNANASAGSASMGKLTFGSSYHAAEIDADVILLPNTTYYLWLFPSVSTYSCYDISTNSTDNTLNMTGSAGLVYVKSGSEMKKCQAYVKSGSTWKLHIPYKKNGSSWEMLT